MKIIRFFCLLLILFQKKWMLLKGREKTYGDDGKPSLDAEKFHLSILKLIFFICSYKIPIQVWYICLNREHYKVMPQEKNRVVTEEMLYVHAAKTLLR